MAYSGQNPEIAEAGAVFGKLLGAVLLAADSDSDDETKDVSRLFGAIFFETFEHVLNNWFMVAEERPCDLLPRRAEVLEAMESLQSQIMQGVPRCSELEQYKYFTCRAERESCLKLHDSVEKYSEWAQSVDVKRKLRQFLPAPALKLLKEGKIEDLQSIMDDSNAGVYGFLDVFANTESAKREAKEFCIIRIANIDDPTFEVYYVRIRAYFKSTRVLFFHGDEHKLEAEYKRKVYKAKSIRALMDAAKRGSESTERRMQQWMRN